ncbi:uncharacterized protein J4E79_007606 [Alternaria viburni]|uniref:uncharacterized protein n=1 Tax=Alternaria viburni TaxID=566460 RepID=UPI0020C1E236|nr:uncharacterized protein J4E79_007606 [Alternaria viburni]KAI4656991.1 hypothetical protein J4E79_007606 [Alternaria viburni]
MALTKPPPQNHCDDPSTPLHTLDCEHVIKPPSSPSTPVCFPAPKSPCSTNSWLKRQENLHQHPFICPACIEDRIRSQYPRYIEERKRASGARRLTDDVETNVQLWTYETVLKAVGKGGRIEVEEQNKVTPDEDAEMDNLAEQLLDAKIAIAQDSAIDRLMEEVSRL